MAEIISSCDLPEGMIEEELSATEESQPEEKIEFHVQMRGYTQRDMEALIIEAAARVIVGRTTPNTFHREVEKRCADLVMQRADAVLAGISTEIIDQPMTPTFGEKKPVTMREFLALYGREYLSEKVDRDGKPSTGGYGSHATPRMDYIVRTAIDAKFKSELAAATNAAIAEVRAEVKALHTAALAVETARIREALAALAPA